jgi:hypothetical protein
MRTPPLGGCAHDRVGPGSKKLGTDAAYFATITGMPDPIDEHLFAVQREYDDLEAALLQMLPEFREYLAANDPDERWLQEQRLSTHPDFLRWKTLGAEIAALYAAKGPRQ